MAHQVRKGSNVWKSDLANGIVKHIDWDSMEVIVYFYNSKEEESLDFHEFEFFNERLNQWIIA